MSDLNQVSMAIRDRISPAVLDWNALWFEPRVIPVPAYAVMPRDPWADLMRAQGNSSSAKWFMQVGLYLNALDEEAARIRMGTMAGTTGPIMSRLRDKLIDDDLYQLAGHNVKFQLGRGFKVLHRNQHRILAAYIDFDVTTKN